MANEEKRSYVRENFSFKVKFRTMTREEYDSIKKNDYQLSSSNQLRHFSHMADADEGNNGIVFDNRVIDFLLQMDDKLDQILALLSNEKEGSNINVREGLGMNISGSGMNILTDWFIDSNSIIQTNFVLSRYPIIFIDSYGEVVRVKAVNENGKRGYRLGVKFLDLDPRDRERIVACVFQWQRESRRRRKGEMGENKDDQ
jgi:hypothetical protein